MAMDIISKDKKEIQWRGLPRTSLSDIEELKVFKACFIFPKLSFTKLLLKLSLIYACKAERLSVRNRIEKKIAYAQELEEQVKDTTAFHLTVSSYLTIIRFLHASSFFFIFCVCEKYVGLQNLIRRNEHLYSSGNPPSGGVALPFILVQVNFHQKQTNIIVPYLVRSLSDHCCCYTAPDTSSCDRRSGNIRRYAARAFRFQQVKETKTRHLISFSTIYVTHLFLLCAALHSSSTTTTLSSRR